MAVVNNAFKTKFEVALDSRISKALAHIGEQSACAGIHDDADNAFKARVNHYGGTIKRRNEWRTVGRRKDGRVINKLVDVERDIRIPERHFIDVPLKSGSWALQKFEKDVAEIMSGGRMRNIAAESTSISQYGGMSRTLLHIAKKLAEAQVAAVYVAQPANAESTVKRKGFDAPLRETFDMVDSIRGWVE